MSSFRAFERESVSTHFSDSFKKYFITLRSAFVRLRAHLITSSTLNSLQAKSIVSLHHNHYSTVVLPQYIYIHWQVLYSPAKNTKYITLFILLHRLTCVQKTEKYTVKKTRDRMQICEFSGKYQLNY